MYSVSKQYKDIMNRNLRNRAYMTVSIGIVNNEAQGDSKIDGELSPWSNKNTPFSDRKIVNEYATMERNFFETNGDMIFVPEIESQYKNNMGVATNQIKGDLRVYFGKGYDIKGITLDFGRQYPIMFELITDNGKYTYNNQSNVFSTQDIFQGISYIVIHPIKMRGGEQRLRLNRITMGVGITFNDDTIISANIEEYVNGISEELPYEKFDITVSDEDDFFNVDDDNGFINFLETGQQVDVSVGLELDNGNIEQVPMGRFLLSDWRSKKGKMSFSAKDILSMMDETYSGGNYIHTRTLWDDAVEVITDFGLEPDEYVLDECLKDITIVNPLPIASYAECLQLIANAGRCVLYQNRYGKLCIKANFAVIIDPEDYDVDSDTQAEWSKPQNLMFGTDYIYSDMTKNVFSSDGSMYFLPENGEEYLETSFVSKEIADDNGEFVSNPNFSIKMPIGYIYYSMYLNFDGNSAKEVIVTTYYKGEVVEVVFFDNLKKNNFLAHEFIKFDEIKFEFTKAYPHNRILVNKVSFGDLSDYTLRKTDMLGAPIGYREKKAKSVSVRVFTFENDDEGVPVAKEDNVFAIQNINEKGEYITFENQLISRMEHAQKVAEWLGNYYANNVSYEVDFRGEPRLNASDIIHMESDILGNLQVSVEKHTFTYNGAFGGSLELRRAIKTM